MSSRSITLHSLGDLPPLPVEKTPLDQTALAQVLQKESDSIEASLEAYWSAQMQSGLDFLTVGDALIHDPMVMFYYHLIEHWDLPIDIRQNPNLMHRMTFDKNQYFAADKAWFASGFSARVPKLTIQQGFAWQNGWILSQVAKAKELNMPLKVAMLGPVSFLWHALSHCEDALDTMRVLRPRILSAYLELFEMLAKVGVSWVQLDEPVASLPYRDEWAHMLFENAVELVGRGVSVMINTYPFPDNQGLKALMAMPYEGLHVPITSQQDLESLSSNISELNTSDLALSLGLIDPTKPKELSPALLKNLKVWLNEWKQPIWLSSTVPGSFAPGALESGKLAMQENLQSISRYLSSN